ncbi:hypothetical protein PG997_013274 [Apiospora hydei]|uniref:RNA ligase domain-containing protein n=1 Tax=Apiospora hydei TaxID=1337664 RepID=A0ABR1V5P0_9PEZI
MTMYVAEIAAINSITDCSEYETAMVGNLPCVVKTGEFKVEEQVMVFPVDTFVFVDTNNAILEYTAHNDVQKDKAGVRGVHVKPIMVQGQVSAGLIVKLARFPDVNAKVQRIIEKSNKDSDTAPTKASAAVRPQSRQSRGFGLKKWTPPDPKSFLGERPAFVPSTTAPMIEESPGIFWDEANWPSIWQATPHMPNRMKMFIYLVQNDSAWAKSIERRPAVGRGVLPHARMGICGEDNDFRDTGKNTMWDSLTRMNVPATLGKLSKSNIAIEGFLFVTRAVMTPNGPRPHNQFRIFAVWDIDEQKRLSFEKTKEFAEWLGLQLVPDLGQWGLSEILMGEAALAELGVVYMSMDGQTVMKSRPAKNAKTVEFERALLKLARK